jgi:hypothetical protein
VVVVVDVVDVVDVLDVVEVVVDGPVVVVLDGSVVVVVPPRIRRWRRTRASQHCAPQQSAHQRPTPQHHVPSPTPPIGAAPPLNIIHQRTNSNGSQEDR